MRAEATASGIVPVVLLVVLVGLTLATLAARGRARRPAAVLLLPVAVAWVLFNGPIEGPVLLAFSRDHGLTVSDLLAVVAVVVAFVALVRRDRR